LSIITEDEFVETIILNGSDWQFKGFIGEDWLLRNAHMPDTRDQRRWRQATVPGSVQHDLWQAGEIADPYREMNSLAAEWAADRTWLYKKQFRVDAVMRGKRVRLVFHGVDYAARYYLNGEELGSSEGMFLPVHFEVSERLKYGADNHLCVVIAPAPFEQPQIGYTSKVYTQKTRMNYWWDFCPRMVHLGIWQGVELQAAGPLRIEDLYARAELSAEHASAQVMVRAELSGSADGNAQVVIYPESEPANRLEQTFSIAKGQKEVQAVFNIAAPEIWWPNGAGAQPLYQAELRVATTGEPSDARAVTFGIRTIQFVANEGAGADSLPYTLTVNGRKIYINGWNWVPLDVLYGTEPPEKRARLLRLAQAANVNLLRVWGGGLIEKEAFYDLCDRLGILVWQEFIQSSSGIDNIPSEDPVFIDLLTQTAEAAVRAKRNHPSLAVWCGGNELFYAQDRLCDDSHPALAALRSVVDELDPGRQWFPTSPSGGLFAYQIPDSDAAAGATAGKLHDVHGPWEYQGLREHYHLYNQGQSMLHSEFGVEGLTNQPALDAAISPERQQPVSLDNPVWDHLGSWWVKQPVWMEAWGALSDVAVTQRATQFLQADGLRYAVEAARRRQYRNSGTLPWQFNEPYPMAACTSAVDYFAEPKPVYYSVARAYRPLTVTAVFGTLAWGGEEKFSAEIWCSNTGGTRTAELLLRVLRPDGAEIYSGQEAVSLPENGSHSLSRVEIPLAQISAPYFLLDLALNGADGQKLVGNRYIFSTYSNLGPLLNASPARVKASLTKDDGTWEVSLENESDQTALWLWLSAEKADLRAPDYAYFSDNYFCLLPGEQCRIQVQWSGQSSGLILTGWNMEVVRL
jgi:beta-mannosidase